MGTQSIDDSGVQLVPKDLVFFHAGCGWSLVGSWRAMTLPKTFDGISLLYLAIDAVNHLNLDVNRGLPRLDNRPDTAQEGFAAKT